MEHLSIGLTAILALGVGVQWLAWRLRIPAIPLLLVAGLVAGRAATGLVDPDALFGAVLFPMVSLSVAVILFEGGLSLDVAELRGLGAVVRNLITLGALVTWVISAVFAHLFLGLTPPMAALLGAILIVTGPTVIVPLLRHIRPTPRLARAVKWEGIVNDPIGAILAVLVLEGIVAGDVGEGALVAAIGIFKALAAGSVLGLLGAGLVVILLLKHWVPDFLQSPVTLAIVVTVFASSNAILSDSGLLAVTVMGSALASQHIVSVRTIVEFKENLRVLLIAMLFIVLAARLPIADPLYTSPGSFAFLAALIFVVRPLAVAVATWRSVLNWRERVFLGFMAPRGIVAAAVSSLFAIELAERGHPQAEQLATVTFLVIVVTVALYGFSAGPAARWLRVATPHPQGVLMVGASRWVRAMAKALTDQGIKVLLIDSNWYNVSAARNSGVAAHYGNVLAEHIMDELELEGVGRFFALTPNAEVNALAVLHFRELFSSADVYQLAAQEGEGRGRSVPMPRDLRGRHLFGSQVTYSRLASRVDAGAVIKSTRLSDEFTFEDFKTLNGESALPLFLIKESGELLVFGAITHPTPKPGQVLVSLVDPQPEEPAPPGHTTGDTPQATVQQ